MSSSAAIYARISGEDQSSFSIENQINLCQSLAASRNYQIPDVNILIDNGVSGSTLERQALRQLRAMVQAKAIAAVVCLDPDRLSRSLGHLMLLEEEAKHHGVEILYVYFPREDTPEGKLMLSVRGAVAEYERAKILQRSRSGEESRARNGLPMTYKCTPYGYTYHIDHFEIHPGEAEVVRRIFALRLSGLGIMRIVRLLSAEGIPTRSDMGGGISPKVRDRGVWAPSTVGRMLRNPTYIGKMAWNKRHFVETEEGKRRKPRNDKRPQSTSRANPKDEWIEIPCPAIIDMDTWERVQVLLDHGEFHANVGRKHEYLFLSGRLRCGKCGGAMSGYYETRKAARFYRCKTSTHNAGIQCWNYVKAEPFEEDLWGIIHEGLLCEPEYLSLELKRRQALVEQQSGVTSHDVDLIEGKIEGVQRRLQRWMAAYANETIDLEQFTQLKAEIDAELSALTRLRDELQGKLSSQRHRREEIEAAVEFIRRVERELPTYTIAERRQVIEVLDVRVAYTDQDHVRLYFLIPADSDLDPQEFWAGDAFAEQWGYTRHPLSTFTPQTARHQRRGLAQERAHC
jgi:site-specific DNA recombinase